MMKWWKRLIFSVISLVLGYISLDYLYSAFTKLINASGSAAAYSPKGDGLSQLLGAVMFLGYFVVIKRFIKYIINISILLSNQLLYSRLCFETFRRVSVNN